MRSNRSRFRRQEGDSGSSVNWGRVFLAVLLSVTFTNTAAHAVRSCQDCECHFAALDADLLDRLNSIKKPLEQMLGRPMGALRVRSMNSNSLNPVFTVMESSDPGVVLAILKPDPLPNSRPFFSVQEVVNWDLVLARRVYEPGATKSRDAVVFGVSQLLGFGRVPASTVVDISPGRRASLQLFLEGFIEGKNASAEMLSKIPRRSIHEMVVLDALLGSQDRHPRNWLVSADGRLGLIDNEFTLPQVDKFRWSQDTSLEKYFPRALGAVDPEVALAFRRLTAGGLEDFLRKAEIPERAIHYALLRRELILEHLERGGTVESLSQAMNLVAFLNYERLGVGAASAISGGAILWWIEQPPSKRGGP